MDDKIRRQIEKLVKTRDAIVCSLDDEGFPNAKAMFIARRDGVKTFWFSTNTSSIRVQQWLQRPQACLYFNNALTIHGLMLVGTMRIHTDEKTKQDFWKKGDEQYYPLGPTDPDYCIAEFTTLRGNYYHGLGKHLFDISEV